MAGLEKSVYNKLSEWTIIYYTHPYCSWERDSDENNNKLIKKRRLILKTFQLLTLKKYKTGWIIIQENYLIINWLMIYFIRTQTTA